MAMMRDPDGGDMAAGEAFWRFSLAFYARPGVAEALIALQDRAGMDVNLMLFALWRGAVHGHLLTTAELEAAEAAIAPLRRAVVEPVRALRRRLKGASEPDMQALRRRIAVLELAAERTVQARLAATVGVPDEAGDRRAAAEGNLARYLGGEAGSAEAAALRRALQ